MNKERMLRVPKEILVKSWKYAIRRPGDFAIAGGTVGTGLGIASVFLESTPRTPVSIIVGIGAVGMGIVVNKIAAGMWERTRP